MKYSLVFHVIGIVMWLGSLLIMTRVLQVFTQPLSDSKAIGAIVKRTWFGFGLGGLGVATITGLIQLFSGGMDYYMKQGWFHGKLTLVIVLFVVTFFVTLEVVKASRGETLKKSKLTILHGTSGLSLILIVVLTLLGRVAAL